MYIKKYKVLKEKKSTETALKDFMAYLLDKDFKTILKDVQRTKTGCRESQ